MITIDEMKDLKVYRKPFYLPTSDKDKTGSAIFLMTPNLESSKNLMNSPLFINRKNSFQSYYMEKNVNTMIKTDASVEESVIEYYADYLEESSLSANDREEIPDKQFGLPKKRKYPLHDAKHVKLAAKFFNYVDKEDEEELAINIKRAAKKFHVTLNPGEDNRLQKYIKEDFTWNVDNSTVKIPKEFNAIYISYKDNESCVDTDLMDKTLWHAMNNFSQLHDFENRKPAYVYVMSNTGKLYKLGIIDISLRQGELGFRWIETYKIPNDFVSLKEDYKVIYEPRATVDVYGYTHPKTGIYNACVKVEGIKKPLRGRSELMVFKDNTVFMATKDNPDDTDTYRFPGGSWNEDENPMDAAIRETREEARIEVQDVKFCTTFLEVYDDAANWVKKNIPEEHWWYGYYTCLYIGVYKGKYTGHIDEHDKDPKMIRLGKWYDIDKVYDKLPKHHQHAIDMYKRSRVMVKESEEFQPHTYIDDEFAFYHVQQNYIEPNKMNLREDEYYSSIDDALNMAKRYGKFHVYKINHNHEIIYMGLVNKYSDKWIWVAKKNSNKNLNLEDKYDDYYISKDYITNAVGGYEYLSFKQAYIKYTDNTGLYYVYTRGENDLPRYIGTIKKHDENGNWSWCKSNDVETPPVVAYRTSIIELNQDDLQFHKAFSYYAMSPSQTTDLVFYNKFDDALLNRNIEIGIQYVYSKDKDGNPVLLGAINVYGSEDWEWDYQERIDLETIEVVNETFSKKNVDAAYLTKHFKNYARRGVRHTNKIKRNVKDASLGDEQVPDIEDKGETKKKEAPSIDNTVIAGEYCINLGNLVVYTEDAKNDPYLRRIFYEERLKQDKEVLAIYEQVKASVPFIKYAYIKLPRYQGKNVFYDVSFYNQLFFKNNNLTAIRGLDLYTDLMERMLDPSMPGYTKKTVFIPVLDWENNDGTKMWMYRNGYNPVSMIYQGLSVNPQRIVKMFKDKQVIFIANKQYFRVNFSEIKDFKSFIPKFRTLIDRLQSGQDVPSEDKDDTPNNKESKQAIVNNIIDKLEKSQGIKISNLTGEKKSTSDEKIQKKIDSEKTITSADDIRKDQERRELLDAIDKAASNSDSTDDALDKLEDERIKQIIIDLAAEEEENININNARASRMAKLQNDMYDIEINGKTVKELLNANTERQELPKTSLTNITTINEEWQDLHYINFDKDYDINEDIMKMIDKLSQVQYPIAVRNIKVVDNSTSEDYVDLYTLELEDFRGKRFTVKFDVPKFLPDGKYLLLRGNKKTIQNQLQNMPIIKTDNDTCQIISNYNKIFIRRFGTVLGKSNPVASRLIKALQKYNGNKIKITLGDCRKICTRYELPIDYIDIGAYVAKIETDTEILYLDQDEIKNTYDVDYTQGIPYGYDKRSKTILYYSGQGGTPSTFSVVLKSYLCEDSTFRELYEASVPTIRSTYSKCSILSTEIPLVIVCAYSEGLENTLRKANIKYELKDKIDKTIKEKEAFDYIKFNDGYVVYENTYASCLLMNGLKESDTESYSLKDINSKMMYTDFLDNYGGKIKADGLENFYDCMIDPITEEVLEHLKLPTDYISVLLHGNALLADNKFIKHTDISTKRLRRKELIAVKVYKTLFNDAYVSYANQLRHSRTVTQFSLKQSAVIDKFLADSTASDNSIINGINDVETANEVTAKGESGMNSDRAYSLDKRTYDSSMLNVLAMSTGFAGNVGITRQATIDMNIEGKRGYVKSINNNTEKMNTTKSLSITEALNPFGVTSDYPFRTAMNFIQTAKHAMRTEVADPLLVTNGSDEAMPYLVSDAFAFKAKFDGVIREYSPDNYIIIEYNNGHKEYVNLQKTTEKNSDGGFYVPMQLSAVKGLKEGKKIKANDIIAYDETSFSNSLGESDNIAYNVGTLAKVAVINTDENFEDSAIITEDLCEQVATKVIVKEDRMLPKDTNIFNLVKVGTHLSEGDTLMVFQTPYEEEDMNILLRNLVDDPDEISELGRIPIKSHVTGTVTDIKMYRTVELDELSDSLKKAFNDYEKPIKAIKNKLDKEKISSSMLPATYALPATGKLKHGEGCVLIEIYLEVYDIASIGDKIVFDRANKGIVKRIIPSEDAPYTDFRPNEEISAFAGIASFNARMITSPLKIGSVNKLMIELDRSCKDILGIKYDDSKV